MLKVIRIIFSVITTILAIYSLVTGNFGVMPYMIFSLGAMLLALGLSELQRKRKSIAYMLFLVAAFNIFVAIYTFFN
ncbi:DUF3953 domain-containing protein [Clostridium formicaceticum]|uniref:DUF3953 domain-containing protein n=1 Tax=Clostridium formicaceticum TaxID=1497 RepID=A0AAC9RQE6_9CLOT|nr:DUF3953 domain-containing protein [Clostridium formicaceticum]AOY74686.1 hypothetical protein BJL90_01180 [Clostridium formicaceticum]ARE89063.1 hypothetical protein CLFO_34690 [Clostridium formicaceticum]